MPAISWLLFQLTITGSVVALTVAGSIGLLKVMVMVVLVATLVALLAGVSPVSVRPPVRLAPQV